MARIYNHYHQPESYPVYKKRLIKVTTRETLENTIQFMSLRALSQNKEGELLRIEESLDLYTKHFNLGRVFWMRANTVTATNLAEFLEAVVARKGYVFDIWGFVPGSYKQGLDWGEYTVSDDIHRLFLEKLGDRFIGYDNGEQDGRYIGAYTSTQCPAKQDNGFQQRRFYEFFDRMGEQLQHATTALCSLNYGHFFARENNAYMIGAETAQALPNANLWYAYLRGAGKQYGLLWFGNASVYNRFSWKSYEFECPRPDMEGYSYGPTVGTSLSLLRRLLYVEYLYNSDMLGFESGLITRKEDMEALAAGRALEPIGGTDDKKSLVTKENARLSPIGQLQSDCIQFVDQRGYAGVMYTPIAIVLSHDNGWTMPRHLYTRQVYRVWGQMPYQECDHQLHALFTMLYPSYEDAGFFLGERGFLTPTPYGEQMDVLMMDMRPETLRQYNLAVLAGHQALDSEQCDKLRRFVEGGGKLVAFAGQLGTQVGLDLFGLSALGELSLRTDERITYKGHARREREFEVYSASVLADTEIIAALDDGTPFILSRSLGKGQAILVLSPYGMDNTRNTAPMHNNINQSIPMMYDMLDTTKAMLADLFNEQQLVRVSNPELEYIVNIRDENTLTVTVVNNSFTAARYAVTLLCGREISRKQVDIPDVDRATPGYYPPYVRPMPATFAQVSEEGQSHYLIEGGQMAMWEINFVPDGIEYADRITMSEPNNNLYVSLRPKGKLIDALIAMPVLDQYFTGIKLDAADLNDMSLRQAAQCGSWLKRRGLDVIIDFASLLDHYPHISLIRNMPWKLEKNMMWMEEILDKAVALHASKALFTTHRNAENHLTLKEAVADMQQSLAELAQMAKARGMEAIIMNGVSCAVDAKVDKLAHDFLQMPLAVNIGHCLLTNDQPSPEVLSSARGVLFSAPDWDELGQVSDAHLPLYQSQSVHAAHKLAAGMSADAFICLDGVYASFDQMYLEQKAFRMTRQSSD
ncbi:MAG: hypothetical protein ACOX7B_06090 [Christensenellales bacterium]|jgi:hypothetical protein